MQSLLKVLNIFLDIFESEPLENSGVQVCQTKKIADKITLAKILFDLKNRFFSPSKSIHILLQFVFVCVKQLLSVYWSNLTGREAGRKDTIGSFNSTVP